MPFPILPVVFLSMASLAGYKAHTRQKRSAMTPERKRIYEAALQTLKDPEKLRKLADEFETQGLKKEASLLRKRAEIRELPEDLKKARRQAFKAAMASKNQPAVLKLAEAYDAEGATGAAAALRAYAAGLSDSA